ncbi:MAG: B12-binding domain-containing radical SAM protein [Chloroflexi bacterium]|nr:B12-binding domain-containing radical SAM protein [Chloroflexota bacterium]MCC6891863.1 radical SAM protein [Anaerolineae bacterium]
MDILLAHGYFLYEDPHELKVMKPYPPLGILYISSYLKKQGFDVGVFDSTFSAMATFKALVAKERPSVVGIYTNMMTKRNVLEMTHACKEAGAIVVLGGPEPPYYAEDYLKHGADIIIKGEGELTLEELLPHLAKHGLDQLEAITGIAFLSDDGKLVETLPRPFIPDLSANPWPDREAIDIPQYMKIWKDNHGKSSVSVIQARGCPFTCRWCSHSVYGNTHRRRTPEDAADEVLWIKDRYNPDLIWYADDVFTINSRWFIQYAEALKQRGVRIPFECISRADRLNEEIVKTLAEMGCFRLWNGSESGSQKILDAMDRKVKVKDVQEKTHLLQKYGIETGMFIMLGYEGETIQDLEETVEHLKVSNPDLFLTTVAYPIKGTKYYAEVESRVLADRGWENRSDRDLTVAGRYSRRFYSYATRWMVSEVALNRANITGDVPLKRRLKLMASAKIGRIGMMLTQGEKETSGQRVHEPAPSL